MDSFNFSKEQPPDEVISVMQKTNKLSSEQYETLLDIVFSVLGDTSNANTVDEKLDDFASSNGIKVTPLKHMSKVLLIVGNAMMQKNLSVIQIESDLLGMSVSDTHAQKFCQKWKVSAGKMQTKLLVSSIKGKKLVEFDWKFGVTASSSELRKVGTCFIQMKFSVEGADRKRQDYMTEMSLPQFYDFMHDVEKAKINLESLGR